MELLKTIKLRLHVLTGAKEEALRGEFDAWLSRLRHGEDFSGSLYSATRQQADRLRGRLGHRFNPTKNYPMTLRRDVLRLERAHSASWSRWWLKVPVATTWGGLWAPVQMASEHEALLSHPGVSIREAKLIPRRDHWSVHLVLRKEAPTPDFRAHPNILAVDVGERNPATAVLLAPCSSMRPTFYGREVRGVRRHHAWLRKRLQEKRAFRTLKRMGQKERRRVKALLHPATRDLVARAKEAKATIVIGGFSGGHRNTGRGRRFNRIVNAMPFHLIGSMVAYKAAWAGVPVVLVNEDYTSRECHRCHNTGRRYGQPEFKCLSPRCGWRGHADMNGALNIGKRWERLQGLVSWSGADSTRPMNPAG